MKSAILLPQGESLAGLCQSQYRRRADLRGCSPAATPDRSLGLRQLRRPASSCTCRCTFHDNAVLVLDPGTALAPAGEADGLERADEAYGKAIVQAEELDVLWAQLRFLVSDR
jgi:hypothetical protein